MIDGFAGVHPYTSFKKLNELLMKNVESMKRRALISVSDKTGLVDLARGLSEIGFEIYSTGGTARHLHQAGLPVIDVAEYTQFPEIMDGRVKTLHPKIFGGILCRRDIEEDLEAASRLGIRLFDVVVVNLYPFRETIAKPNVQLPEAIENIDIGGPSLIRAAAKNHPFVSVLTSPSQYSDVLNELRSQDSTTLETRRRLMAEAFSHTAEFDRTISDFFAARFVGVEQIDAIDEFPQQLDLRMRRVASLRYGENSHQQAALYALSAIDGPSLVNARQLHGKELSYNNILDLDAALSLVRALDLPACCVLKHNNPCGAAIDNKLVVACQRAFAGDPVSAFGSVVGLNRVVDRETAEFFCEHRNLFVEAIVAPDFSPDAFQLLTTRPKWKANVRLIAVGELTPPSLSSEFRSIAGGALVQTSDTLPDKPEEWRLVSGPSPDEALRRELQFGWSIVRMVKSNAIIISNQCSLVGVGAGQMSRVDSVKIALEKAGDRVRGSVLASDAFFPFPDSIELAGQAGVSAVIQPGGSVKDDEVIAAARQFGLTMMMTGKRHFKH